MNAEPMSTPPTELTPKEKTLLRTKARSKRRDTYLLVSAAVLWAPLFSVFALEIDIGFDSILCLLAGGLFLMVALKLTTEKKVKPVVGMLLTFVGLCLYSYAIIEAGRTSFYSALGEEKPPFPPRVIAMIPVVGAVGTLCCVLSWNLWKWFRDWLDRWVAAGRRLA